MRPADTSWHGKLLRLYEEGHSTRQALVEVGISRTTLQEHMRKDADFAAEVRKLRPVRPASTAKQADTRWHDRFVSLLEQGYPVRQALREVGASIATYFNHVQRFPEFKARVGAIHRPRGHLRDTTWHAPFLALVDEGSTIAVAADQVGKSHSMVEAHMRDYPDFGDRVRKLRAAWPARPKGPDTWWHSRLPSLIRHGATLAEATRVLDVHQTTLSGHMRRFPELREQVLAARRSRRLPSRRRT